jgi:hypothetical protein
LGKLPKTNPTCSELVEPIQTQTNPICSELARPEPACPEHRRRIEGVEPISLQQTTNPELRTNNNQSQFQRQRLILLMTINGRHKPTSSAAAHMREFVFDFGGPLRHKGRKG